MVQKNQYNSRKLRKIILLIVSVLFFISFFSPIPYIYPESVYCAPCVIPEAQLCPKCPKKGDLVWTPSIFERIYTRSKSLRNNDEYMIETISISP